MSKRRIKKVAIIGSGIMGSGIACHFANIGIDVLLLDIVPRELNEKEKAKGLTLEDKAVRNRLVNDALMASLKSNTWPMPGNLRNKSEFIKQKTIDAKPLWRVRGGMVNIMLSFALLRLKSDPNFIPREFWILNLRYSVNLIKN